MTPFEELVSLLQKFTPEELDRFLNNPVTLSILQPEEASELCPQAAS